MVFLALFGLAVISGVLISLAINKIGG
jgi:hypothetical protein